MQKSLLSVIFCISMLYSFAQTGESDRIMVNGDIKDQNLRPVPYAHILVKSKNEGGVGDYYGNFRLVVLPGDTLIISAISFHHAIVPIPFNSESTDYLINVVLQPDTVFLRELVVHPFPSTYRQLKEEFMKVEIEDPLADLDLHLPSPRELKLLSMDPTYESGQIRIYSGSGPIGLFYDQFSKEARSKRIYAELMRKEKADKRYNKIVVSRITGLKNEDDIRKFMDFCALQIRFILESTDYELYAAIMHCYDEFCKSGLGPTDQEE